MSTASAEEYADSIAEQINAWTTAGAPFGWINPDTDEWTGDEPETDDDRVTFEDASAYDYLESALDIEYRVNGEREYRSAEITLAVGGPNAWIDTKTRTLHVAWWWSKPVERTLPSKFIDDLDDALEELWADH